jgi:DNA-directed RNA polymerase subunit omega
VIREIFGDRTWTTWRGCFRRSRLSAQAHNNPPFSAAFFYCVQAPGSQPSQLDFKRLIIVNAELTKKALEKVGNPNVLVNLVSRRVRQLNSGGGALSRPLVEPGQMGLADIALTEIIEEKIGWEMPELVELTRPTAKKRAKRR